MSLNYEIDSRAISNELMNELTEGGFKEFLRLVQEDEKDTFIIATDADRHPRLRGRRADHPRQNPVRETDANHPLPLRRRTPPASGAERCGRVLHGSPGHPARRVQGAYRRLQKLLLFREW